MAARVFALQHDKNVVISNKAADKRDMLSQEQEQERSRFLTKIIGGYAAMSMFSSLCMLVGAIANAWYICLVSNSNSTTSQTTVTYNEDWGLGSTGVIVKTFYCTDDVGCLPDKDYYVKFNREGNIGFDWPEEYSPAVENSHTAGQLLLIMAVLATLGAFLVLIILTCGVQYKLPRWLAYSCVVGNAAAAILAGVVAGNFFSASQEVVSLLESDSIIQDTSPVMSISWAAILSFLGPLVLLSATFLLFKAAGILAGEATISINDELDRERMKRIRQYQADLFNTTHSAEQNPIDTAPPGHHGTGWTRGVLSVPKNHVVEVGHDGALLNTPDHVLVNDLLPPKTGGNTRSPMTDLIPSFGTQTHKPDSLSPIIQLKQASFASTIPGFGSSTTPIDLVGAKQRMRGVTRAPVPHTTDRPRIEAFVSASASRKLVSKYGNGASEVQVMR